jgi:hypothetical protein
MSCPISDFTVDRNKSAMRFPFVGVDGLNGKAKSRVNLFHRRYALRGWEFLKVYCRDPASLPGNPRPVVVFPVIQFAVCGNTKEGMEKEGQPITVLSEAVVVPSGVVRLMELQEKGWSYVRP